MAKKSVIDRVVIGLLLGVAASGLVLSPHAELYPAAFGVVEVVVIVFLFTMSMLFAFSLDSGTDRR